MWKTSRLVYSVKEQRRRGLGGGCRVVLRTPAPPTPHLPRESPPVLFHEMQTPTSKGNSHLQLLTESRRLTASCLVAKTRVNALLVAPRTLPRLGSITFRQSPGTAQQTLPVPRKGCTSILSSSLHLLWTQPYLRGKAPAIASSHLNQPGSFSEPRRQAGQRLC